MFSVRRSTIEPQFLEVVEEDRVVREIEVPFQIRQLPVRFRSIEEIELWVQKTEKKLARICAYRALAQRCHSSRGLLEKLRRKKFSEKVCEEVLEEVKRLGYIADAEFFQRAIEKECERGKGPHTIARKLGVEEEKVRDVVTREKQREQIEKLRKRGVSDQALFRRGFDFEIIRERIKEE